MDAPHGRHVKRSSRAYGRVHAHGSQEAVIKLRVSQGDDWSRRLGQTRCTRLVSLMRLKLITES